MELGEGTQGVDRGLGFKAVGNFDLVGFAVEDGLLGLCENTFVSFEVQIAAEGFSGKGDFRSFLG